MKTSHRAAAAWAAAALLLAGAASAGAQTPAASLRARPDAATSGFADADVAWILPLLHAEAGRRRGELARTAEAIAAVDAAASEDALRTRVEALRSGRTQALQLLRAGSDQAAVPPGARYDAACSAALTESMGGFSTTAAYSAPDVAGAEAFYRRRGWRVSGDRGSGYVLRSPDGRVRGSLSSTLHQFRRIAADVRAQGLGGYDHVAACTGIPDRTSLVLELAPGVETGASPAPADAMEGALRQAGLTATQWARVFEAVWQAEVDGQMPDPLSPEPANAQEAAVRRANARWLQRNRSRLGEALDASSTGG